MMKIALPKCFENVPKSIKTGVLILVPTIVAFVAIRKYRRNKKRKAYPKDVVILHQFPPGLRAPSASPFVLKLETWLRMAKIEYQNEHGYEAGPKGKWPWITLNGEDMADSQFIIEFLSKKFNVDFAKNHSAGDNAIARAFLKLTEESIFWLLVLSRYVYNPDPKVSGMPYLLIKYVGCIFKKRGKAQGYMLHSQEELRAISKNDLRAIDDFIGNKKYLLGDSICDVDAAIFGMTTQLIHMDRSFLNNYVCNECPNIIRHFQTIKKEYWPDWTDRVQIKDERRLLSKGSI